MGKTAVDEAGEAKAAEPSKPESPWARLRRATIGRANSQRETYRDRKNSAVTKDMEVGGVPNAYVGSRFVCSLRWMIAPLRYNGALIKSTQNCI